MAFGGGIYVPVSPELALKREDPFAETVGGRVEPVVSSEGRRHIGDGGVNCVTPKGTQRRSAKAIISSLVRERTDDFALFLWCEGGEERVVN